MTPDMRGIPCYHAAYIYIKGGDTMARRKKRQASAVAKQVEEWLEMPIGSLASTARIEISDNRRALVEGCQGILEYDNTVIRLSTGSGVVRFEGGDLSVSCMNQSAAVVNGLIARIELQY